MSFYAFGIALSSWSIPVAVLGGQVSCNHFSSSVFDFIIRRSAVLNYLIRNLVGQVRGARVQINKMNILQIVL